MKTQFTSQQAKNARTAAQLSQGRVASEVGINRSYLSQFECGKYLLDDAALSRLFDYYSKRGVKLESLGCVLSVQGEDDSEERYLPRLRDGFQLPQEADEERVDLLLDEYSENRHRISNMSKIDLSNSGFLGFGIDEDKANKKTDEVINIMARNYAIIEELQGHDLTFSSSRRFAQDEKKTVRDYVRTRLKPYMSTAAISES